MNPQHDLTLSDFQKMLTTARENLAIDERTVERARENLDRAIRQRDESRETVAEAERNVERAKARAAAGVGGIA